MRQASETVGIRGADLNAQTTLLEMQRVRLVDDAYWNAVLYEGERESEACGACTDLWGIQCEPLQQNRVIVRAHDEHWFF